MVTKITAFVLFSFVALLCARSAEAGNWFSRTFGSKKVRGSGVMETEIRTLKPFNRIEVDGAFDLSVSVGPAQEVLITFDDNLLPLISTEVVGKTLEISALEPYDSRKTCRIEISVPSLVEVISYGSSDISIEDVEGEHFECYTKGSGDIVINGIVCDDIECSIKGSGDISLKQVKSRFLECKINGSGDFSASGKTEELEANIHGSGDVDTRKLKAKVVSVTIKGSGDARVAVEESLDAAVYGSGDIAYYGEPHHISRHISGSGEITRR